MGLLLLMNLRDLMTRKVVEQKLQVGEGVKRTTLGMRRRICQTGEKKMKDYTVEKAKEAKDYTAEKAKETKDYTADKAKEGKDTAVGKIVELIQLQMLPRKAMAFLTGKKEKAIAKGTLNETKEDARRKLETMHLKDQDYKAKGTRLDTSGSRGHSTGRKNWLRERW